MGDKLLFNQGFMFFRNIRYGLVDLNVTAANARVDVRDTQANNALLAGIGVWTFTATIFVREELNITPSEIAEEIVFQYGSKAWFGSGFMFSCAEVGRISDALVYNLSGEFINPTYNIELIRDNLDVLIDLWLWSDYTNWVESGTGVWTLISSDPDLGPYLELAMGVGDTGQSQRSNLVFETGEQYRIYLPYQIKTATINNSHLWETGIATDNLELAIGSYVENEGFTAAGGDNELTINADNAGGFTMTIEYYFILLGKLLQSI